METADVDNLEKVKDYTRQLLPDWDGEELHPEMSAGAWFYGCVTVCVCVYVVASKGGRGCGRACMPS